MKKSILILALFCLLPLAVACLCSDLFTLSTGLAPFKDDYTGSWHSEISCGEEGESEEPYRWGIILFQDADDQVTGTLYFHDCPGGGAVTYALEGTFVKGQAPLVLQGIRTGGRSTLFGNSPPEQVFEIFYGGEPIPNFAP